MNINFKEFKSNPILYVLFLPLVWCVWLYYDAKNQHKETEKIQQEQIDYLRYSDKAKDSFIHRIIEVKAKQNLIDSLNFKMIKKK